MVCTWKYGNSHDSYFSLCFCFGGGTVMLCKWSFAGLASKIQSLSRGIRLAIRLFLSSLVHLSPFKTPITVVAIFTQITIGCLIY